MMRLVVSSFHEYCAKICRSKCCTAGIPSISECFLTMIGCTIGVGTVTYLTYVCKIPVLVASLGASACLIYGVPTAPFSQPRNAVFGQLISALVGVFLYQLFGDFWFTAACSVGLAVAIMARLKILHPPAGATALIAVITHQGWLFPIIPVGGGIFILVIIGVFINNLFADRQYPIYWK